MEYVQLCKTLYTLLQDSPEEQELLQAMGRVANSLLKIGEDNVTTDESTGQTHSETSPSKAFGIEQTERLLNAQQPIASMDDHNTTDTQPDEKKIDTNRTWSGDQPTEECHETPQSEASASTFDVAVADAAELEAKWYLNFEQFVAGIQQEPELCQFFAEQNIIDLSGTSVDPILSQYTRTILSST